MKMTRLLIYVLPQAWRIAGLALVTAVAAVATAMQPWPLKLLIDNVLGGAPLPVWLTAPFAWAGIADGVTMGLAIVAAAVMVLFAVGAACEAVMTWGWTLVGRRMTYQLGDDLFERYQRRSLNFHLATGVGETLARVADDSWLAYRIFDALLFKPLQALLILGLMLVLMVGLDWQLALVMLVVAPLMMAGSMLAGRHLRATAETGRRIDGRIRAHVQQTMSAIATVQAFGQEQREEERLRSYAAGAVAAAQRNTVLKAVSGLGSGLVSVAGVAVVLWLGAHRVLAGELALGSLLVFVAYLRTAQTQIAVIARIYPNIQSLSAIARRVDEALATAPEIDDAPGALPLPPLRGRLELDRVSFGYEPGRLVLDEVSLTVEPGETVALVGATGAGKSTLAGLFPRFFDPDRGCVRLDGHDLRSVRLASLRSQVAIVHQEPFLLPLSIADNIGLGRPGAGRDAIAAAAAAANADDFIRRLPQGFDTIVGERGATLSGGERQRIAIARALLKDAPVLVLDEPTSALDAASEAEVLQALRRLTEGRTTLVIAHRLSTVRHAHRIVVLQDGRIAEIGLHAELVARDGVYARLSALQFGPAPAGATA